MAWTIWITGLPGSGKSTIAEQLKSSFPEAAVLRMDDLRKVVTPQPDYSDAERDLVYRAFVYTARTLCSLGHNVIMDATGSRRAWRALARDLIPEFYEVYLKCGLAVCMEREAHRAVRHGAPEGIYEKGKAGAPVPGLAAPYEEPEGPELSIDTEKESPEHAAQRIIKRIREADCDIT